MQDAQSLRHMGGPPGKGTQVWAFEPSVVESVAARVRENREGLSLSQAERNA